MIDKTMFKAIFDRYFDSIRLYIYYKISDADAASDMAQDVFVAVWEKRDRFEESNMKALLYRMASGRVVDYYRHADKQADFRRWVTAGSDTSPTTDELVALNEAKERYALALQRMTEGGREVFMMSREEQLTYSEIASRLGLSVKAVEKRMSGALKIINDNMLELWTKYTKK
jgi:RNA polymerase sigma-70 factor (family 1)